MQRRWRFKRVMALLLLLAAGAIVNVAVAWGCAARFDSYPGDIYPMAQADIDARCDSYTPSHVPRDIEIAVEMTLFGLTHQEIGSGYFDIYYHEAGFPVRSLRGAATTMDGVVARCGMLEVAWPFPFLDRCPTREFVYAPLWPGFAINTIFYAAILWGGWLLFFAPGALRRTIRRRRGFVRRAGIPWAQAKSAPSAARR